MKGFAHIDTWIFDLDNTLYPASCRLFDQMHVRMSDFIIREFKVSKKEASRRRQEYFLKYGTTLRGLMVEHGMAPERFLDYVHEIDYSPVKPDDALGQVLAKLPGRKMVFTNGTTPHAKRVLDRLGCAAHFEGIYDIVDSHYIPKPDREPYEKFVREHRVRPETSAFFEDIIYNLVVPREMGMKTVLISHQDEASVATHVDHVTDDLAGFLGRVCDASFEAPQARGSSG